MSSLEQLSAAERRAVVDVTGPKLVELGYATAGGLAEARPRGVESPRTALGLLLALHRVDVLERLETTHHGKPQEELGMLHELGWQILRAELVDVGDLCRLVFGRRCGGDSRRGRGGRFRGCRKARCPVAGCGPGRRVAGPGRRCEPTSTAGPG